MCPSVTNGSNVLVRRALRRALVLMLEQYGPQGWWPVRLESRRFVDPMGERQRHGYHPSEFEFPATPGGRWEVVCGAVLTQNTAWRNVEVALSALHDAGIRSARAVRACEVARLAALIRPAGYFNQKAIYLRQLADWFLEYDAVLSKSPPSRILLEHSRPTLLGVRGVGPETADSILLYAYRLPTFVVDAYTRRVFGRIGLIDERAPYESIRRLFETALAQRDTATTVRYWQEAHALIVEHAKRFHGRQIHSADDFLLRLRPQTQE